MNNMNDDINKLSNKLDNLNISNNTDNNINNINNDLNNLNISGNNNNYFGQYGYPNNLCVTTDAEDFVYNTLILPNIIFNELTDSGLNSYAEYFDNFSVNNEEIFIKHNNMYQIAKIFDDLFLKKPINFNDVRKIINNIDQDVNDSLNTEEYIHNYLTNYNQDLFNGLSILTERLISMISFFNKFNRNEILKNLNNYCVIIIYLKFMFESNIFSDYENDENIENMHNIIFI